MSLNIISSISELPLNIFIDCVVHGKFERLIKSEYQYLTEENKVQIQDVWVDLLSEYYKAHGNKEMNIQLDNQQKTSIYEMMVNVGTEILTIYEKGYNENIATAIMSLFPTLKLSEESYQRDLLMIRGQIGTFKAKIDQIQYEISHAAKKGNNNKAENVATVESFYETILAANEAWHTTYKVNDLTALEYALICKKLQHTIEQLNKTNTNGK